MKSPALRRAAAFSLLEIIVAIAIIVIVMTLLAPSFSSLGRAANLTKATSTVLDELNLARQTALARNRAVEVRFYRLRDTVDPTIAFRAVRSLISDETGAQMIPLAGLKSLPVGTVVVDGERFSTLLSDATRPVRDADVEDLPDAPRTPFKLIRFRPTGGVELPPYASNNDNWFLSLKNERDPPYPDRPADNFATIQLDPTTGRARQLRP